MYDIISIGDATIDNFFFFSDASVHCSLNKENCWLQMVYGTKIPVNRYYRLVAGNATNAAIGSARLGLKTAFYTELGDDSSGREIKDKIIKNNVDSRYMKLLKDKQTNISAVLSFKGERTIMVYHLPRKYKLPRLASTKWIYLTSSGPIGPGLKSLHKQISVYLTKHPKVKVAFNPGTHQLKMKAEGLKPLLKRTNILFLNKEESALLLKKKNNTKVTELLKGLKSLGPEIVVLTDGPKGSYAYDGENMWFLGIYPAKIVERTGCGDSYGTAFTAAIIYKKSIPEAMKWGTVNAAGVIQKIGPQEGLLKKRVLCDMIKKRKSFNAKTYS